MPILGSGQTVAEAINQIYQNVLRRDADSAGISSLGAQFVNGTSLNTIRDTLVSSAEATSFVDPIVRLYEVAFGRQPDETGLSFWVNIYRNGSTLENIASGFTGSQEFIGRFGTSTDRSAFVENLYLNGLGRASDPLGKTSWVDSVLTDEQLLLGFSESSESLGRLDNFTTILLTNLSDGFPAEALDPLTAIIAGQSGQTRRGEAVNLSDIALGVGGFKITGEAADDQAGTSVSSAGDVNNDGFDDLLIGANFNDAGGTNAGAAYVVYGSASGLSSVNLDDVALGTGGVGFKATGNVRDTGGSIAGFSVSSAGDVNGDGIDDFIVGAPGNKDDPSGVLGGNFFSQPGAGAAYVVFGTTEETVTLNLARIIHAAPRNCR